MTITTYQELQDAVQDYLIDQDLSTRVTTFIHLAESEFNRIIRHRRQEAKTQTSLTEGQSVVSLPGDFNEMRSAVVMTNPRQFLQYVAPQALETKYNFDVRGLPKFYTVYGSRIEVRPEPDANYPLEILYYRTIPRLTDVNPSNWLLQEHPDLYLYSSLMQAQPFIINDARIQTWQMLLERAYAQLDYQTKRSQWNGSPMIPMADFFTP